MQTRIFHRSNEVHAPSRGRLARLACSALVAGLLCFATGCAAGADPYTISETRSSIVHPRLEPHVQEFLRLYGQMTVQIPVRIGPLEDGVAGKCYIPGPKSASDGVADAIFGESTQAQRRIVISRKYFDRHQDDYATIENVVFHELGHCLLARGHESRTMPSEYGEIPRSIMAPRSFGDREFYRAYRDYYAREIVDLEKLGTGTKIAPAAELPRAPSEDAASADTGNCVEYFDPDEFS